MMKHKRLLVPVDLLKHSDRAFEYALALAARSGAELYLLHAVPVDRPFGYRAAERLARFAELRRRADAVGVAVQTVEQHGDAANVIVLHANTRPVDVIVMTSGRRTGWARLRQPSIAERVLRRAMRPALIVRSDGEVRDRFDRVVVAVDGSPATPHVVRAAIGAPGVDARQLTLVHAVQHIEAADAYYSPARWGVGEYRGYVMDDARAAINAMVPPEIAAGVMTSVRVSAGPVADVVGAHAEAAGADLIVVGRNDRFMRLGSTAARLLRTSARALLVIPAAAAAAGGSADTLPLAA